jgi:hypothetical protein
MAIPKTSKRLMPEIREQADFNTSGGTGGSGTIREAFSRAEQVGSYWRAVEQDLKRQVAARRAQQGSARRPK